MAPENFRGHFFAVIECDEVAVLGLHRNIREVRRNHKSQITNLKSQISNQMHYFVAIRG